MARRVAVSELNASTIDILNTIRANASYAYQNQIPEITKATDIPAVGQVLYGYPALANEFLNALVNRIAMVRVKSAVFNNAYAQLKKGYLEFGETVEEVFVNICKAREFSAEKAEQRELKRTLPDVRSAFHTMNWRVQYPVTIQDEDLRMAFLSADGVRDMIARIVDSVYTAAEYDEYLLFKYLLIKGVSHGEIFPKAFDATNMDNAAVAFRSMSNQLTFMSTKYNNSGVHTTTPRDDQYIFMDADFNAKYDVEVLAAAFNMDKADFMGRLILVDDWTTFDNDRFSAIVESSDMISPVTDAELALMKDVKAVLCDREWFQVYDNQNKFTEKYVASGEYWNYFYNVWKTVSSSPFSNAVVFVDDAAAIAAPASIDVEVMATSMNEGATVITLVPQFDTAKIGDQSYKFVQTEDMTSKGIAVHPYGAIIYPDNAEATVITVEMAGNTYKSAAAFAYSTATVGDTVTLNKV